MNRNLVYILKWENHSLWIITQTWTDSPTSCLCLRKGPPIVLKIYPVFMSPNLSQMTCGHSLRWLCIRKAVTTRLLRYYGTRLTLFLNTENVSIIYQSQHLWQPNDSWRFRLALYQGGTNGAWNHPVIIPSVPACIVSSDKLSRIPHYFSSLLRTGYTIRMAKQKPLVLSLLKHNTMCLGRF